MQPRKLVIAPLNFPDPDDFINLKLCRLNLVFKVVLEIKLAHSPVTLGPPLLPSVGFTGLANRIRQRRVDLPDHSKTCGLSKDVLDPADS